MIRVLLSDFSRVLLFVRDSSYTGKAMELYKFSRMEENFSVEDVFEVNEELLRFYRSLLGKFKIFMYTAGEIHDVPKIREKLAGIFSRIFMVTETGRRKNFPDSYRWIAEQLGVSPSEVLFIDDKIENVQAAREAGMEAIQYLSNGQAMVAIREKIAEHGESSS